jgi:hypothetical protein|tara:strand:- start:149 stop:1096 length:948 start_codon:yes stop_codon:yes gene_type:complete
MRIHRRGHRRLFVALTALLLLLSGELWAQQAAGGGLLRLGFLELATYTFQQPTDHPFYQMTGNSRFKGGRGYFGLTMVDLNTIYPPPNSVASSADGHDAKSSALSKIFRYLPTFSLEYIMPMPEPLGFMSWSASYIYTNTWLTDLDGRSSSSKRLSTYKTPLIRMSNHFHIATLTAYPTGQPQPNGINPYIGFGLAYVESTIRYGFRAINPADSEFSSVTHLSTKSAMAASSSGFVSMQRIGLAASGNSYGFSLEFLFMGANGFIKNPFKGGTAGINSSTYGQLVSAYNNSGTTTKTSAGMRGAMMRASVLYSFF